LPLTTSTIQIVHAEAERLQLLHCSEGEEGSRRVVLQKQGIEGVLLAPPLPFLADSLQAPPPPPPKPAVTRYVPPALRRQQQQTAKDPE